MSVRRDGSVIYLEGDCSVEQAEPLAGYLESETGLRVDVSQCRRLHSALVQALLRFKPEIEGVSEDSFIRNMITPALAAGGS